MLNVSIQQLLGKIEKELKEARGSTNEARIRERIHAIKSLCELVLEEPGIEAVSTASMNTYIPPAVGQIQPASIQQPKRLKVEDDANGDSLFDF